MNPAVALLVAVAGYLLGSISFARLVARVVSPGSDVTRYVEEIPGTGLIYVDDAVSATLVNLHLGARYGCLTSLLDMAKVVFPMLVLRQWTPEAPYHLIVAAMALVGHNWPIYHRFRGGRGESVVYGSMLVLDPLGAVACNLMSLTLGVLAGQVHLVRWGGIVLLIPWLWWRTGDGATLAYILVANVLFWISMRRDVAQFLAFERQRVFASREELSRFLDIGGGLGRWMDRYSLPALFCRLARAGKG